MVLCYCNVKYIHVRIHIHIHTHKQTYTRIYLILAEMQKEWNLCHNYPPHAHGVEIGPLQEQRQQAKRFPDKAQAPS